MLKRYVQPTPCALGASMAQADLGDSGLARTLRASAFARPTTARRAFQPTKSNFTPALGARFASGVGDGKIHQVIGAVVDGKPKSLTCRTTIWQRSFDLPSMKNHDLMIFSYDSEIRHRFITTYSQCLGDRQPRTEIGSRSRGMLLSLAPQRAGNFS